MHCPLYLEGMHLDGAIGHVAELSLYCAACILLFGIGRAAVLVGLSRETLRRVALGRRVRRDSLDVARAAVALVGLAKVAR